MPDARLLGGITREIALIPPLSDKPITGDRYTSREFMEREWEGMWTKVWLVAGRVDQVPNAGDYINYQIGRESILCVRGSDGRIRAFYNVCKHRGHELVQGDGSARALVCPYHAWSFSLDGQLKTARKTDHLPDFDRSTICLDGVRVEEFAGFIYVNLDTNAVPLLEWLDPLPRLLADVAASPMRVIDTKTVEIGCNWKILAEGFLEVYHARTVHPTTVAPTLDTRGTVISLFDHGHQNMLSPVRPGTRGDGRETLGTLEHLPAVFAAGIQPAHGIFPQIITPMDARGFPFMVFWPVAIDRTRLDIVWFAADWGDGELPARDVWQKRLDRFDVLMDEDYINLEPIQRSMEHAVHGGQVINYQERRIWHVHAWIDKVIGQQHIAEHLRVPDLLADWVETV